MTSATAIGITALLVGCQPVVTHQPTVNLAAAKAGNVVNGTSNSASPAVENDVLPPKLTPSEVQQEIMKLNPGHTVRNLHIIALANFNHVGFAFISYDVDGKKTWGNLYSSSRRGTGLGTFSLKPAKGRPLQYTEWLGEGGYNFIAGSVADETQVTHVVITFIDGKAAIVPVENGYFWYAGKVGSTDTDSWSKTVIGITNKGDIVRNKQS